MLILYKYASRMNKDTTRSHTMFPSAFNSKRFGCYKSQPPLHTIACPWETGYDALKQKSPVTGSYNIQSKGLRPERISLLIITIASRKSFSQSADSK